MSELPTNLLYFGDNLDWLRQAGKFDGETHPKIQIMGAQDIIGGKQVRMPRGAKSPADGSRRVAAVAHRRQHAAGPSCRGHRRAAS